MCLPSDNEVLHELQRWSLIILFWHLTKKVHAVPVSISTYLYYTKAHAAFFSCHGLRGHHAGLWAYRLFFYSHSCRKWSAIIRVRRGGMPIDSMRFWVLRPSFPKLYNCGQNHNPNQPNPMELNKPNSREIFCCICPTKCLLLRSIIDYQVLNNKW